VVNVWPRRVKAVLLALLRDAVEPSVKAAVLLLARLVVSLAQEVPAFAAQAFKRIIPHHLLPQGLTQADGLLVVVVTVAAVHVFVCLCVSLGGCRLAGHDNAQAEPLVNTFSRKSF